MAMSRAELQQYFVAWMESLNEVGRLARLEVTWRTNIALAKAQADEKYDRTVYLRLKEEWREEEQC
jgi:hypothetical protein